MTLQVVAIRVVWGQVLHGSLSMGLGLITNNCNLRPRDERVHGSPRFWIAHDVVYDGLEHEVRAY